MAYPTLVNGQITDAVTQTNVQVLGEAPSLAMGMVYQAAAQATGILLENAVSQQQAANMLQQAVLTRAVARLVGGAE